MNYSHIWSGAQLGDPSLERDNAIPAAWRYTEAGTLKQVYWNYRFLMADRRATESIEVLP